MYSMKKFLFLVSCFAVVLMLNNAGIAQDDPCIPCVDTVAVVNGHAGVPMIAVPLNHPGLNINQRDVRRAMRLEARIAQRHMRLEAKLNPKTPPGFPFLPLPGEPIVPCEAADYYGVDPCGGPVGYATSGGYVPGTTIQSGRINASIQRQRSGGGTTINFLSVIRPAPRYIEYPYPVYGR